jgi:hypothetical protein
MDLAYLSRNVASSRRARKRMQREGCNMRGQKLWDDEEKAIVRKHYPDYDLIHRTLPHRTRTAIITAAAKLGIRKSIKIWTAAEISHLRKLYPAATRDEICDAFPGATWVNIQQVARYRGFSRARQPYKPTGHPGIDQVRERCFQIRWTMADLDAAAGTKKYFQQCKWIGHKNPSYRKLGKAISALAGDVVASWSDCGSDNR